MTWLHLPAGREERRECVTPGSGVKERGRGVNMSVHERVEEWVGEEW